MRIGCAKIQTNELSRQLSAPFFRLMDYSKKSTFWVFLFGSLGGKGYSRGSFGVFDAVFWQVSSFSILRSFFAFLSLGVPHLRWVAHTNPSERPLRRKAVFGLLFS